VTLAVMWTLVVVMYGWINLPRANQVAHNPQILAKLSNEAASIMFGRYAKAEPGRGVLVWSEVPRIVRMSNGARLTFPATATNERVALVAGEYDQLLRDVSLGNAGDLAGAAAGWRLCGKPARSRIPAFAPQSDCGRSFAICFKKCRWKCRCVLICDERKICKGRRRHRGVKRGLSRSCVVSTLSSCERRIESNDVHQRREKAP
jgi:hypothetical protein